MVLPTDCSRLSAMAFFIPSPRAARDGQVIHEKTTVSSSKGNEEVKVMPDGGKRVETPPTNRGTSCKAVPGRSAWLLWGRMEDG